MKDRLLNLHHLQSMRQSFKPRIGVYFLFHGQDLVYIGCSANIDHRLAEHKGRKFAWNSCAIIDCGCIEQARHLEKAYIAKFRPVANMQTLKAGEVRIVPGPNGSTNTVESTRRRYERKAWWRKAHPDYVDPGV